MRAALHCPTHCPTRLQAAKLEEFLFGSKGDAAQVLAARGGDSGSDDDGGADNLTLTQLLVRLPKTEAFEIIRGLNMVNNHLLCHLLLTMLDMQDAGKLFFEDKGGDQVDVQGLSDEDEEGEQEGDDGEQDAEAEQHTVAGSVSDGEAGGTEDEAQPSDQEEGDDDGDAAGLRAGNCGCR